MTQISFIRVRASLSRARRSGRRILQACRLSREIRVDTPRRRRSLENLEQVAVVVRPQPHLSLRVLRLQFARDLGLSDHFVVARKQYPVRLLRQWSAGRMHPARVQPESLRQFMNYRPEIEISIADMNREDTAWTEF